MRQKHEQGFQHQPWVIWEDSWQCFVSGNMPESQGKEKDLNSTAGEQQLPLMTLHADAR